MLKTSSIKMLGDIQDLLYYLHMALDGLIEIFQLIIDYNKNSNKNAEK
jgi:hypothetical protein